MTSHKSEFILNPDGSVYHLALKPEDIAKTVIFVGDPYRVESVSQYFDKITFKTQKREFKTHTGVYKNKKLSVISTGIGVDNIEIVLQELDALFNVDFKTKKVKTELTKLNIIRIGTSGAIQKDISVNSFLLSQKALDINSTLQFYDLKTPHQHPFLCAFKRHLNWKSTNAEPKLISNSKDLETVFSSPSMLKGITVTAPGFYAPQGRSIRLVPKYKNLIESLSTFKHLDKTLTNIEMETSAIYGFSELLGHRAISLNAILANRISGEFSDHPEHTIDALINYTLEKIVFL